MTNQSAQDFDNFADNYSDILTKSVALSGESGLFFIELKIRLLQTHFWKIRNEKINILDYGCGTGRSAQFVNKYFPNATFWGIDPSKRSIDIAMKKYGRKQNNFSILEKETDLKKGFYDIVFSACVFHHIPPEDRVNTLKKINNSLNKKGNFVLFEHNPYNPITVKIVKDCPFDEGVKLLKLKDAKKILNIAGFNITEKRYYFFFPKFLSFLRPLEKYLSFIPFGGQYMLIGNKRK